MKNNKPFLTIEQQINKLKSQGLIIFNNKQTRNVLYTHSYYSFVNGYCDLLVKSKSPRVFKKGASFKELKAIYNFDISFSRFLLPQILYVEDKIKSTCINGFCGARKGKKFLFPQDSYLFLSSYETFTPNKEKAAKLLIGNFKKAIKTNLQSNNPAFSHAYKKYGYIPFWVLATNLTFGQLSKFYECLFYEIRQKIAKKFGLDEKELRTSLKILNMVRNLCAHSNKIFNAAIPYVLPSQIGLNGSIYKIDPTVNHKFGSALIAFKYLVSEDRFKNIIKHLRIELMRLNKNLKIVRIQDVLRNMGISPLMNKNLNIYNLEKK